MSQNSNTLLLFFDKEDLYKKCFLMLKALTDGDQQTAQKFSKALNVDFSDVWGDDWFNLSLSRTPRYIRLDFDTGNGDDVPLHQLQQLFSAGLRAACLEIFFDQVGELGHYFFADGKLVSSEYLFEKFKALKSPVEKAFDFKGNESAERSQSKPVAITDLIKGKQKQDKEATENVEAMMEFLKHSRESGVGPLQMLQSTMIVRAAAKGLLQGLGFGVLSVLLFNGFWLWLTLGILATICLPLFYMMMAQSEYKELTGQSSEESE